MCEACKRTDGVLVVLRRIGPLLLHSVGVTVYYYTAIVAAIAALVWFSCAWWVHEFEASIPQARARPQC
jgi:hypothetical protein